MTYPQYQSQPQGYAPAYPAHPETYAVDPQQLHNQRAAYLAGAPQPAAQGQAIAPPVPQLRDGSSGGGTPAPKFRHLLGRTIIVEPIRVDEDAMDTSVNPPVKRPEAYFHLTVVDGGPVRYGDSQDRDVSKQRPNTHESDTPARWTNVNDRSYGFVQAVRDALNAGEPGRVGVVQKGTKGNKPYLITKCGTDVEGNARPDGDARYAAAMEIFGRIWHDKHAPAEPKQFVSPEPRSLVAPPAAAPPQVAYGAPQGYAQPPQAAYAPVAAPAVDPAYAAWMASQQQLQSAPPAAAPAPNGYYMPGQQAAPVAPAPPVQQVPAAVEAWLASLPPEQREVSRGAYLASQQSQPPGPGI